MALSSSFTSCALSVFVVCGVFAISPEDSCTLSTSDGDIEIQSGATYIDSADVCVLQSCDDGTVTPSAIDCTSSDLPDCAGTWQPNATECCAVCYIPTPTPTATPTPSSPVCPPEATLLTNSEVYNTVGYDSSRSGEWGGYYRCPNGQRYIVGDDGNGCTALAGTGGVMESCTENFAAENGKAHRWVECGSFCQFPTTASPTPTPTPTSPVCPSGQTRLPNSQVTNTYTKESAAKVGEWGGTYTCPNGEVYVVGDNNNGCATLAGTGGTENGDCGNMGARNAGFSHYQVVCGSVCVDSA